MQRFSMRPAICTQRWLNALRQQQHPFTIMCLTQPLRMNIPTTRVGRKYEESTPVSDIVCASSTRGLTLSNTIHDLCTTLGMMPMPETIQQHANESVGCLFSHFCPLQRHPIDVHFAGLPVYETLRDIAAMHKKDIWTLSDAAGAGGTPLPDDLTPRTKQLMIEAINKAGMTPAISEYRRRHTMSGAKDLYRAITTATYSAYSVTDEKADQMHGSGGMGSEWAPNEVLRALTIKDGFEVCWPADIHGHERQLFVRREYDRVFDALFKPTTTGDTNGVGSGVIGARVLPATNAYITGMPGIGKTYMSSYYLWRLLTCNEVVGLQYVLYCAWGSAYIFDKVNRTVARYLFEHYASPKKDFIFGCDVPTIEETGIMLLDCFDKTPVTRGVSMPTIVFSSTDTSLYEEHYFDLEEPTYVVNVWEASELCAWALCIGLSWSDIKVWYKAIGGMPRFLMNDTAYTRRCRDIEMRMDDDLYSLARELPGEPDRLPPLHVLSEKMGTKPFDNENEELRDVIVKLMAAKARQLPTSNHARWENIILDRSIYGKVFSASFLDVCCHPPLAKMVLRNCKPLVRPKRAKKKVREIAARSKAAAGLKEAIKAMEADVTLPKARLTWTKADYHRLAAGILYVPVSQTFPLVDAFMLVKDVFICIQITTSRQRPHLEVGLKEFQKIYDKMNISPKHKVIVFVQPKSLNHCITTVQLPPVGCDADVFAFWAGFSQYGFTVDDALFKCI